MSIRRIAFLTLLTIYTIFAVSTFWLVRNYPCAGIYFILLTAVFFKIVKYSKKEIT